MNREELIALANKIALCAPVTPEGRAAILLNKSDWTLIENLLRTQASGASTTEAKPMTESEGKLAELIAEAKTITTQDAWNMSISDAHRTLVRLAALGTPAQPASGGVDIIARLNAIAPAVENLACHQEQCDADGVMVKVSRQAVDEVVNTINQLAIDLSASSSPASEAGREAVVSVKPMELTGGRTDYFVSIRVGDREVTPHVFREEYKAAYHVALYDWLLNGGDKPDLVAFGPNDWPARASPPHPANQVDQERGEKEKNHG